MPFCAGVEAWALECPDTVRDVEQPRPFYFPGMHLNFEWAVRAWNFGAAPCKREKRPCRNFDEKWFLDMRTRAAAVVQQSHRLSPEMATKVEAAMEQFRAGGPETKTFGVHMRGSDKAHSRRMVAADEFAARIESFLRAPLPNFLAFSNKLAVAADVLVDIECLAKMDFFVYAASAVAEAVFYRAPALHGASANLEGLALARNDSANTRQARFL
ncbi:hypothetical protein M885DRAFT_252379 [Pelagophyceae sp. CCMP2097]|nr:hypothetical protein M885DRAFT_252379 [Pelagophyceae sp. CCMP2097]